MLSCQGGSPPAGATYVHYYITKWVSLTHSNNLEKDFFLIPPLAMGVVATSGVRNTPPLRALRYEIK